MKYGEYEVVRNGRMLKTLRIKNFKAWKDTGELRMAPLTVFFGPNSAGKSSIGHLLLALKQTVLSSDRRRALQFGDSRTLVDLGTFSDCIYGHDLSRLLEFSLRWSLPHAMEISDPLKPAKVFSGSELGLDVGIEATRTAQPSVRRIEYCLFEKTKKILNVSYTHKERDRYQLASRAYTFVKTAGRPWPLYEPEKFYRIADQSRARFQNAGFLLDLALAVEALFGSIHHLGPLREHPQPIYTWSGELFEDVGPKGENTVGAMLTAQSQGRKLNHKAKAVTAEFIPFIAKRLKEIGIIHSFALKQVGKGRKEYEVLIKTNAMATEVRITDVGFGISQVLPAIVQPFYSPPNSIVLMEQPEIHLHPQVQAGLADVFISAIQSREGGNPRNVQLVVESHSEHFLTRLQRRVAEGRLDLDDVAIYFCSFTRTGQNIEALNLNEYGEISNWPEKFFGDEMGELTARTIAAMERKQRRADA
jgi:predicted ATPase